MAIFFILMWANMYNQSTGFVNIISMLLLSTSFNYTQLHNYLIKKISKLQDIQNTQYNLSDLH